jgi:1,2-diacylglycerol 3-alpha-glucosyltransferase
MTSIGDIQAGMYTDTMLPRLDGIGVSLEAIGGALQNLGVSPEVVTPAVQGHYEGTLVRRTSASFQPWFRDYNVGLVLPWLESARTSAKSYDIVHVHTLGPVGLAGLLAAHRAQIPAVLTWHTDVISYRPYYPEVRLGTLVAGITLLALGMKPIDAAHFRCNYQTILRQILSAFDTIIVPTEKAREQISRLGYQQPLEVIPSPTLPLPTPPIGPAALRSQLGISPNAPVLLSVGRLSAEKNQDLLVRAFAILVEELPDARLVLVGARAGRRHIMRLASSLRVDASLSTIGIVQRELLGAYYSIANVFILSSLSETQSLVAQEAEAFGLPVVLVDERLSNSLNRRRLVAKPDPASLASVISQCLVGMSHRQSAQYPSPDIYAPQADTQAKQLFEVYVSLLSRTSLQ